jgi:putative metallohydrolase (TIGR04338 family)
MRDPQAKATYAGEQAVGALLDGANSEGGDRCAHLAGSLITLPVERKFSSVETMQLYVDRVLALRQVRERFPHARQVRVRKARNDAKCAMSYGARGEIAIPMQGSVGGSWALRELVLLHELAHQVSPPEEHHGRAFRDNFAWLAGEAIGPEVALALRVCWAGIA